MSITQDLVESHRKSIAHAMKRAVFYALQREQWMRQAREMQGKPEQRETLCLLLKYARSSNHYLIWYIDYAKGMVLP